VAIGAVVARYWGDQIEFVLGGAMINIGYRLQDHLEDFDLQHHEVSPQQVLDEVISQNGMAASVRSKWPRSTHHPLAAMVVCMDARLDTNEIAGDTRRYYYILRLAGSVIAPKEEEMLELAISNGTKVVLFMTHSDCAAEKAAADPVQRALYPNMIQALSERKSRFKEFLARENVQRRIAKGELLVKWMHIDTNTDRIVPLPEERKLALAQ
jgi:hypothetical protein